jgi:hypothetical protein
LFIARVGELAVPPMFEPFLACVPKKRFQKLYDEKRFQKLYDKKIF